MSVKPTIPEWLNESFFQETIEKLLSLSRNEFKLRLVDVSSVVDAGENYCSNMYRVKVECCDSNKDQKKDFSFIVKSSTSVQIVKEHNFFGREFEMYAVLKKFEELWEQIGEPTAFGPKCFKIVEGETEVLVLSDLKEEGFAMLDRFEGLNEAATLLVLERIAKFHAVSLVYREKFGAFGPYVQQKYMRPEIVAISRSFADRSSKMLIEAVEDWGMDEMILDLLRKAKDVFMEEFIAGTDPDTAHPDDFQVLCHGDLWLNNMMFKGGNDDDAADVLLIDFQGSHWNRPEGDLLYFFITSVNPEVLASRFDYFLSFYHEELLKALEKLNWNNRPSLKSFLTQVLRNSIHVLRSFIMAIPVIMMNKSEVRDLDTILGESEENPRNMFKNAKIEKMLRLLLPFFCNRGMLESTLCDPSK